MATNKWEVQVGKGKDSYTTVLTTTRFSQAIVHYNSYNAFDGGKKRLLRNGNVCARQTSTKNIERVYFQETLFP